MVSTLLSDETYLISSPASVPVTSHQMMTRWNCWLLHQGRRTPGSKLCCSLPSNLVDSSCSRDRRLEGVNSLGRKLDLLDRGQEELEMKELRITKELRQLEHEIATKYDQGVK